MTKKLRIWHNSSFGRPSFRYEVTDIEQAKRVLRALADYDLFLVDGEDRPWTTVAGRSNKRTELTKTHDLPSDVMKLYNNYLGPRLFIEANAQGLEVFEDNEWTEWYDEETGNDIGAV